MTTDTFAATTARLAGTLQRSDEYLEQLQGEVKGAVILRHDAGYDAARRGWNLTVDQRPALIVAAREAGDVVAAVRYARHTGLGIAVQSTGHGVARPADDALLIVTSALTDVRIDAAHADGVGWRRRKMGHGAGSSPASRPGATARLVARSRRHRLHAGRRHGLAGAQARPGAGQRAGLRGRHGGRAQPARERARECRALLGHARRGRQPRHRDGHADPALPGDDRLRRQSLLPGHHGQGGLCRATAIGWRRCPTI